MSHHCVKTSSFHSITQITPPAFQGVPHRATSYLHSALPASDSFFCHLLLPHLCCVLALFTARCKGSRLLQVAANAGGACFHHRTWVQKSPLWPQSLAFPHTHKADEVSLLPCRSTSWMFWMGFGHISATTALSLDSNTRGKKIHSYLHQYKTTSNIQKQCKSLFQSEILHATAQSWRGLGLTKHHPSRLTLTPQ